MKTRTIAAALLAAALAGAGCGGDDSSSEASSKPLTAAEAERAYSDFYAALYAGEPDTVCALLTDGARDEFTAAGKADSAVGGETCEEVAENTSTLMQSYGSGDPKIRFGSFGVGSAGDSAQIEATVADGPTRTIPVVREGDAVLIDGFGD